ncbi:HORMA domain-containing protein 1 [Chytriomyces hyalinus]|nr:HORMA domain-containing protein 1 [Chytriomyces hyalinus]
MAVVQMQKLQTAAATTTATTTATRLESLQLTQNLLRSSIATIAYLRGLFPEQDFDQSLFNGMSLKRMKKGVSNRMDSLCDALEAGCFDALQKGYLRLIVFSIYRPPSDASNLRENDLIESYEFEFQYPSATEVVMSVAGGTRQSLSKSVSKKESVKAMADMLRRIIILTQTMKPLPDDAEFSTRVYYYDDVTPINYEPPNFRQGKPQDHEMQLEDAQMFELGSVKTNHHALALNVRTGPDIGDEMPDEGEERDTQETEHVQQNSELPDTQESLTHDTQLSQVSNLTGVMDLLSRQLHQSMSSSTTNFPETDKSEHAHHTEPNDTGADESNFVRRSSRRKQETASEFPEYSATVVEVETSVQQNIPPIDCPCSSAIVEPDMLVCKYCNTSSHPACFGYENSRDFRIPFDGHRCFKCWNRQIHPSSFDLGEAANVAVMRRGLSIAANSGGVESIVAFSKAIGVSVSLGKQVTDALVSKGFLKPVSKKSRSTTAQAPNGFSYVFTTGKRRTDAYSFWMSTKSLPASEAGLRAFARRMADGQENGHGSEVKGEDESDGEDASQVVLGKALVSSGVSAASSRVLESECGSQAELADLHAEPSSHPGALSQDVLGRFALREDANENSGVHASLKSPKMDVDIKNSPSMHDQMDFMSQDTQPIVLVQSSQQDSIASQNSRNNRDIMMNKRRFSRDEDDRDSTCSPPESNKKHVKMSIALGPSLSANRI